MPKKKAVKKKKVHKLDVRIMNPRKEIDREDLLPESQAFLAGEDSSGLQADNAGPDGREEKHKMMVMWSGISFFMLLIIIIWSFNMREVFRRNYLAAENNPESFDKFSSQLAEAIEIFKKEAEEIDKLKASSTLNNLPGDFSAASINELKGLLVSTSTATGTASSTAAGKK